MESVSSEIYRLNPWRPLNKAVSLPLSVRRRLPGVANRRHARGYRRKEGEKAPRGFFKLELDGEQNDILNERVDHTLG
jgi:hypothetical protein